MNPELVSNDRRDEIWTRLRGDGRGQSENEWSQIKTGFDAGFRAALGAVGVTQVFEIDFNECAACCCDGWEDHVNECALPTCKAIAEGGIFLVKVKEGCSRRRNHDR